MKPRLSLLLVWIATGASAVCGSLLGAVAGQHTLFAGAVVGGLIGAPFSVALCARLGWFEAWQRRAASVGAATGFLVAVPIAATNLHTPIIPVLICSLAGAGALIGAGRAARP